MISGAEGVWGTNKGESVAVDDGEPVLVRSFEAVKSGLKSVRSCKGSYADVIAI